MGKYKLSILPLFENDMLEAITYITEVLNNPAAAERLINETEKLFTNGLILRCHFLRTNPVSKEKMFITEFLWGILLFSTL